MGTTGTTGAAFSNSWFAEGPISSGSVVSGSDTHRAILVNNSVGAATVTLPLANSGAGKLIHFQGSAGFTGSNTITINRQGTDQIVNHDSVSANSGLVTACTVQISAEFVSDGSSRWYLTQIVNHTGGTSCDSQ